MNKTGIEWCLNPDGSPGYTWNPITGCLNHVKGMCKGGNFPCWAYKLAHGRLKNVYLANKNLPMGGWPEPATNQANPFYLRSWFHRRERALEGGKPKGVFVCDMSDLFGIGIPESWTQCVLETIKVCPEHRFYLLTKQPQNLVKFSPFPDNCRVGVTATYYWKYVDACNYLARVEAKIKYISFEPLLSWDKKASHFFNSAGINQVIIGAQTKPTVMPKIEWVREIETAARKANIAIFEKNNLQPLLKRDLIQELPK